jgi:hypothetical protein
MMAAAPLVRHRSDVMVKTPLAAALLTVNFAVMLDMPLAKSSFQTPVCGLPFCTYSEMNISDLGDPPFALNFDSAHDAYTLYDPLRFTTAVSVRFPPPVSVAEIDSVHSAITFSY